MSDFESGLVVEEPVAGVAVMRFDRPAALNAITSATGQAMVEAFCDFAVRPDLRCLVITGTGTRAFSTGADLKERARLDDTALRRQHATHRLGLTIRQAFAFPVIAAVNGLAHGGGAELALSCDMVIAADHARFCLPEVKRGIMPGMGGTQFLARKVGAQRAMELILSGREIDAQEALALGIAGRIVPQAALQAAALESARQIAASPPLAVSAVARAVRGGAGTDLASGLALELALHQRLMASDDRREGIAAFVERRTPHWRGR